MRRVFLPSLILMLLAGSAGVSSAQEPLRLSASIEGLRAVIEVRDQSRQEAEASIRAALAVMAETLESLDGRRSGSAVAHLNALAGQGPQPVDGPLLALLRKATGFCVWSQRAQGPLGGKLYQAWENDHYPTDEESRRAHLQAASCGNLEIRPQESSVSLASGCRIDLRHFGTGFAVDRASESLRQRGAANFWVELGQVARASGPGPDDRGWRFDLPLFAGMGESLDPIRLNDLSVAAISSHGERLRQGDAEFPALLDQRTGRPSSGVLAVVLATPLATDAQALATTMMILGNREGQLRLANVDPAPAVLWLLGDGSGEPLLATYRWSSLGSP